MAKRRWVVLGPDGRPRESERPGALGGHRGTRIFGRLDCRAALRAIARGGYVRHRVFFIDQSDAEAAGYRPCAVCMPDAYARWKAAGGKK
jgi:methylphosphotriester-DNA--protein-cysteine methyltransferase